MKKVPTLTPVTSMILLLLLLSSFATSMEVVSKPIKIEVETNHASVEEALVDCENILLEHKFIAENKSDNSLNTKRRGVDDGFYSANVNAKKTENGVLVSITFIKSGMGFYSIKKLAKKVEAQLKSIS